MVSLHGVAPSRRVCVSASVNLRLHHKSRSSRLAPAHPGGPGKRAVKWLWCGHLNTFIADTGLLLIDAGPVRGRHVLDRFFTNGSYFTTCIVAKSLS